MCTFRFYLGSIMKKIYSKSDLFIKYTFCGVKRKTQTTEKNEEDIHIHLYVCILVLCSLVLGMSFPIIWFETFLHSPLRPISQRQANTNFSDTIWKKLNKKTKLCGGQRR